MSFLNSLLNDLTAPVRGVENLVHQPQPATSQPQARQPLSPASVVPDITYNPNPNTNVPYSAHSPTMARLGNQYVANPTSPRFIGIDPRVFGFPADNTVRHMPNPTFNIPNGLQSPSYNNGQVSLNGEFMQGNLSSPEYTVSPYANLNRQKLQ